MDWGGPEFVLAIVAMAMLTGVVKTSIRSRHHGPAIEHRRGRRPRRAEFEERFDENHRLVDTVREENRRLSARLEMAEDRLIVLERIVTDRGYDLAHQIEALRDMPEPATREGAQR